MAVLTTATCSTPVRGALPFDDTPHLKASDSEGPNISPHLGQSEGATLV